MHIVHAHCWYIYKKKTTYRVRVNFHCCVIFMCVNKIEVMYEGPCVNVKVELGSSFIFTSNLPYMTSILFAQVKFQAYARKNYVTVEIQQSFCPSCHQLCCSLPYWITCIDCEHWIYINKKETSLSKCQWVCKLLLHTWKLLKNMTNKILLLLITETFFLYCEVYGIKAKKKDCGPQNWHKTFIEA